MSLLPDDVKRVEADDTAYLDAARAEALFWQERNVGFLEGVEQQGGDSVIELYTNERFTGDAATPWYATIPRTGSYKRALFLGTSGMAQDAHLLTNLPDLHVTICDISAGSLERWQSVLGAKFPGRVDTLVADLNFAEFEENAYDLIVSSSTLHHVINLEHAGAQINRALTADGRFFFQDYVGESMYRFSDTKKLIFEDLYNRDIARQPGRQPGLIWLNEDRDRYSPFCGIRAGDILDVLASELREIDRRTAGCIVGMLLFVEPADKRAPAKRSVLRKRIVNRLRRAVPAFRRSARASFLSEEYLRELRLADEVFTDAGTLEPFDAFVTYGKRSAGGGS